MALGAILGRTEITRVTKLTTAMNRGIATACLINGTNEPGGQPMMNAGGDENYPACFADAL